VTDKKKAEHALIESERQFQAMLDNSQIVMYLKDLEGKYILINSQFEKTLNVDRHQFLGKTDYDVFPHEVANELRENDQKVITNKESIKWEEVVPHNDGGIHTYLSVKFPLFDSAGQLYAVGGLSTDITDRKKTELALRDSEISLAGTVKELINEIKEKENLSRQLDKLSARIHNSIKNKIESIRHLLSGYINSRPEEQRDSIEQIEIANRLAHHCSNASRNILFIMESKECPLNKFLLEIEFRTKLTFSIAKIDYNLKIDDIVENVILDPEMVQNTLEIYSEILHNILKHSQAKIVDININYFEDSIKIKVKDNGVGFDYLKARESRNAFGLRLIEQLSDQIEADLTINSQLNEGTISEIKIKL